MKLKIKNEKLKRNVKNQIKKLFILLLLIPNVVIANSAPVVITKIAAFEKSGYRWIEICNRSGSAVDTNGWKFIDKDAIKRGHGWDLAQGEDLILASGECAFIVQDKDRFLKNHENWTGTIIDSTYVLNQKGEEIGIRNTDGETIESFTYIACPDNVLERVDINLDDYTVSNWVEAGQIDTNVEQINTNHESTGETGNDSVNEQKQDDPFVIREDSSYISEYSFNRPPVAVAGSDLEINAGDTVFFDGSDSFDEDGDVLEYSWDFGDGSEGEGIKIEHTYLHSGKMSVILRVYDGEWTSSNAIWINAIAVKYAENIFINAFLPNPIGPDTQDEWIEVCNDGSQIADLSNWRLDDIADGGSKEFLIKNIEIDPEKCFRFMRSDTKIAINNNGDDVRLTNPAGDVVDQISFDTTASSGEIFYRDPQLITHPKSFDGTSNLELITDDEVGTQVLREEELESEKFIKLERTTGDVINSEVDYTGMTDNGVPRLRSTFASAEATADKSAPLGMTGDDPAFASSSAKATADKSAEATAGKASLVYDAVDEIELPMAVRTGDIFGETLNGEIVKISGNVVDKSGNVLFVDDGSGEIRIQILPKMKIKYDDIVVGDRITIDGEVSKTQVGYRVIPNIIE